jgi:hypothetical protein
MTGRLAILLAVLAAAPAAASPPALDPAFFPPGQSEAAEHLQLLGLAQVFPGRVLFEEPVPAADPVREEPVRVEDLRRKIRYLRVYRLEGALPTLVDNTGHAALILDLRYLDSTGAGAGLAALSGESEIPRSLRLVGEVPEGLRTSLQASAPEGAGREHPVVVLCNRRTAGPFEAVLHALQERGRIIGVGEATAGRTGFYRRHAGDPPVWIQCGEIRPPDGASLVGRGFVPRISVETTAEENYAGYFAYESGMALDWLLRHSDALSSGEDGEGEEEPGGADPVLQRGVDIIAALQVLGRLPDSD